MPFEKLERLLSRAGSWRRAVHLAIVSWLCSGGEPFRGWSRCALGWRGGAAVTAAVLVEMLVKETEREKHREIALRGWEK